MSKALQPHFELIAQQRAILQTYENWEYVFDALQRPKVDAAAKLQEQARAAKLSLRIRTPEMFAELYAGFHHNLDKAESSLKIAASIGTPLDISSRPVAHDIRCISDPFRSSAHLGDKQRARDNLMAIDFYDECGHMPGVHVSKVTIPKWPVIPEMAESKQVCWDFENAEYTTFVIASFENRDDANIYKLTVA
jgi:hypothetical protein